MQVLHRSSAHTSCRYSNCQSSKACGTYVHLIMCYMLLTLPLLLLAAFRSHHQVQPTLETLRAPADAAIRVQKAAAGAAAVAVALALHGSVALGPALAQEQQQVQPLCISQPVRPQSTGASGLKRGPTHAHCPHCACVFTLQEVVLPQQQQQWRVPALIQPLAELAGFFDNADPTDPFTLYGTNL
jgi:hypothetical protein